MSMQPSPRYVPTSVQDVTTYDPLKGQVRAKRVDYRLADGTMSYVILPEGQYSAENLTTLLEDAANLHDEIMAVQGQPVSGSGAASRHRWSQTG